MILKWRHYRDSDYQTLHYWMTEMEWPLIPKEKMPKEGAVVYNQDGLIMGISVVYCVESKYNFMFPAVLMPNPNASFKQLTKIMDVFATAFEEIAKINEKNHIVVTTATSSIANYFARHHGYHYAERNITRMVKCLDKEQEKDLLFFYDDEGLRKYFPDLYAKYLHTQKLPEV